MSSGQAHTTWFPELKQLLRDNWKANLTIPEQFKLVADLNNKLNHIRAERNIRPPMMLCPKCNERHRSKFMTISITAMYFALKRFEISTEIEFNKLKKNWEIYSKEYEFDIYGKLKTPNNQETKCLL